jgi:hypothetical protein
MKTPTAAGLEDILLGCLRATKSWPGADGLSVADILLHYPDAMATEHVSELQELLRRHPGTVDDLEAFLTSQKGNQSGFDEQLKKSVGSLPPMAEESELT